MKAQKKRHLLFFLRWSLESLDISVHSAAHRSFTSDDIFEALFYPYRNDVLYHMHCVRLLS